MIWIKYFFGRLLFRHNLNYPSPDYFFTCVQVRIKAPNSQPHKLKNLLILFPKYREVDISFGMLTQVDHERVGMSKRSVKVLIE